MVSKSRLGLALVVFVVSACSKAPPEPTASPAISGTSSIVATLPASASASAAASAKPAASGSAAPSAAGPEELAWDAPSAWQSVPNPSPMRKATYKISEDTELTVSAASGGVEQNIKRWEGQFGQAKAKTEPRNPNGLKVTVVEIKGTFSGGGMMGAPSAPKKDQMLLGAIVDAGEKQHFFKMVGSEKTVTAAKKDFDAFVASLRAK
ncbi:MAG: hypothetical protein JST00_12130 [Deltaproteobacteria bacterium]|nr:hypothetical protein [Deltaproteobacteria bacterium]